MGDAAPLTLEALRTQLRDAAPEVRSHAAVRIAELWRDDAEGFPPLELLLELLAEHDRVHPGIADAFWTTIVYDFYGDRTDLRRWMLGVLEARQGNRELSPVPGNDLEFYAHEEFDDDPEALRRLLSWGYVHVVELALDHSALGREDMISLLGAVAARSRQPFAAQALATNYGVLLPGEVGSWPERVLASGARVRVYACDYGSKWSVSWCFPWPEPLPLSDEDCLSLEPVREGSPLDASAFAHVPFPAIPQGRERLLATRSDIQVRVATDAEGRVVAVRVVRWQTR
jgi:hypothetical protein